ncbi:MAG: carotenoid oxygenase family protein [Gammaproteobacteria bacterium]
MAEAIAAANRIPSCHGGLENLDDEHDYWIDTVTGTVPHGLRGTFYRNGPGRQRIGEQAYGHWFDGDGMLAAFTFVDGRVHFRNRYVRTPKYLDETAAQAVRYRGFGTQIPGGWTRNALRMPANPANTNTIWHGGHLLALNEGGKPWALDPQTLDTLGEFDYDGALGRSQVFSAHGHVHPKSGHYINFGAGVDGIGPRGPKPCLFVYRIDANGTLFRQGRIPLKHFPFCHDFAITERHAVFFLGSIVFGNMAKVMLGGASIADQVHFDPAIPMQIVVCDLDTLTEVQRFETSPGAAIHFGNAFEADGEITVDAMCTDNFDANQTLRNVFDPAGRFGGGHYERFRLHLGRGTLSRERVTTVESEFPTFNPRITGQRHHATWTACSIDNGSNSFFNGVQRVDFDGASEVVTLEPGCYGSEPLFVPAPSARREDEGWLLEVVYDAWKHRSELRILRADHVSDEVARLTLPHHLPHQFHGFFTPELLTAV